MKTYTSVCSSCLVILVWMGCAAPNKTATRVDYTSIIEARRFTFQAQTVIPTEDSRLNPRLMLPNGNNLYQLSSGYHLKITPDSVVACLPFFGRAFTAPVDPMKGGIQFVSTRFDYKQNLKKKSFEITITPQDVPEINTVRVYVGASGYASVHISSLNRTPISYNGVIEDNQ